MNDDRPTKEQNEALPYEQVYELSKVAWNNAAAESECDFREGFFAGYKAATASDPGPPRPADMAELARMVAKELRKRGIWSEAVETRVEIARMGTKYPNGANLAWGVHSTSLPDFNNLTPHECADLIQANEAKLAAEWAGDELTDNEALTLFRQALEFWARGEPCPNEMGAKLTAIPEEQRTRVMDMAYRDAVSSHHSTSST